MDKDGGALFGREREIAELHSALLAAEAGTGTIALLSGEPGIGKTRLATDFARDALARGANVTWGRAWEAGGAPAYWPVIEALRPLVGAAATATHVERERLAPLVNLVPELEGCGAARPVADPARERFRLFEAASTLLSLAARERALVVVLDDLHVADIGTLSLLLFIARTLRSARVVVVGTYRDVQARVSPEAGELLSRIAREGRTHALSRLAREDVASWASSAGVADADALFAATEGNPLFVVEILRLGNKAIGAHGGVSDGVRDVIRQRLALLSPGARALLDAASVMGRTIDLGVAAALVEAPLSAVRDLASESTRRDVLAPLIDLRARGPSDRYVFSHILVREVLYQDLQEARRAALHAQVARALLERHGDDPNASLAEAVHHVFAADAIFPAEEAITWARRGAERAVRRLAFEEAALLLERASEHVPRGTDLERCDLLLELAAARIGAGQVARGRETALEAAELARRMGDGERLARAALGYGGAFVIAFVDRTLVGLLEEALAALPAQDGACRAKVLARLAAALQPALHPEHPNNLAREAIAMARRASTDEPTRLAVLVAATSALSYFGDPRERLELDTELLTLATRHGDRVSEVRALMRLVFDHLELGDDASADHSLEEYDARSRALDLPAFRWRAPAMRAMRAIMQGKFDAAEALSAEAAEIAARGEDAAAPITLALQAAGRLSAANRLGALSAHLPLALELMARFGDPIFQRSFRVGMLARLGRAEEAKTDLDFLVRHDPPLRGRPMFVWAADACLALGDREAAASLIPLLSPVANRRHFWSPAALVMEARSIGSVVDALRALAGVSGSGVVDAEPTPLAAPRSVASFVIEKDGDTWVIRADTTFHLRDSRGLSILARLVASPGREFHATDLVAPPGERGHVEDAGDVLDARAIAAYRERLEDLREAEAEATRNADAHRASRAREEIEALAHELAGGLGLGGRGRKASSTAEKARVNVRKRILDAIHRVREHSPALAKHLERSVRTGVFCSYDP